MKIYRTTGLNFKKLNGNNSIMNAIRKKLIYLTFITALVAFSCKKEKQKAKEEIIYSENLVIGQWIYDKIKLNDILYDYEHVEKCGKDRFYFQNRAGQDHQYEEIRYITPTGNCAISQTNMGWKIKGRNLLLNFGQQVFTYNIIRLDDTNFQVSIKTDFNNDGKIDNVEIHAIKKACTMGDPSCQE